MADKPVTPLRRVHVRKLIAAYYYYYWWGGTESLGIY
jgi:hypothetical protein